VPHITLHLKGDEEDHEGASQSCLWLDVTENTISNGLLPGGLSSKLSLALDNTRYTAASTQSKA